MPDKPAKRPRRPRTIAGAPPKRRKVTMYLDADVAKKLHHAAIERGKDIGTIAGPLIEAHLAQEWWHSPRTAPPPAEAPTPKLAIAQTPVDGAPAVADGDDHQDLRDMVVAIGG